MPYTPPSHRSPAPSASTSPDASRRSSFHAGGTAGARPSLPRSASYLTRHRRTPSAVGPNNGEVNQPSPEATSDDLKSLATSTSVRASPPPITDGRRIPKGAIISPPESQSSSDDELPEVRGRRIENLKELQDAISQLPVHRESSPSKGNAEGLLVLAPQGGVIGDGMHQSFSTGSLGDLAQGLRRVSHARSNTDPAVLVTESAENSLTASDEDSDDETRKKPQMVRKKSGELVRPALRLSHRRPSSMPGTPTFSKAVHFDSHLEHVRHFLQVDRPTAVSAGSSPAETYESDNEFPFPGDQQAGTRSPQYEWEIIVANFPLETPFRKALPARLERVWLSSDQKSLIGSIAVANLAFHKRVTCRFTLDYWKTTSEVGAEYVSEILPRQTPQGHDRFNFTIKLSDLANLESKTLYFCIRYTVNGQEHWDNNDGTNFQVDFRKKMLPQNIKKGIIGAASRPANGLPRSTRRANPSLVPRPKSMPVGADEFGDHAKINFDQSIHDYLGETSSSLRLNGVKSTTSLPSDNLSTRLSAPSGLAFANRYDFGASLSAAMQAAKDAMPNKPDGLYMKQNKKPAATGANSSINSSTNTVKSPPATNTASTTASKPLSAVLGSDSPLASISSSSYEELVNKYCFFGSKQSSPQLKDGTMRSGRFDGADDEPATRGTNSTESSSNGSPITMASHHHHRRDGLPPQSSRLKDSNPYFQHAALAALGASPSRSPDMNSAGERNSGSLVSQPRSNSASGQSTGRSASPASMVGSFSPFAGTSPNEFSYQHTPDRFPFGSEAHTATAIRG